MFSLPKLLTLAVIIAVVWYGFKLVGTLDKRRKEAERRRAAAEDGTATKPRIDAEDLVPCPKCGTYVTPGADHDCADRA